jgi:hypothetical protein
MALGVSLRLCAEPAEVGAIPLGYAEQAEHLHAGVRAARVADDERQMLLDRSRKLEYVPGDSFAKLQYELSIGE